MPITLAESIQKIKPSPTLTVTQKAKELKAKGVDVIGLGAGEPDFDTPEHIKQAAIAAINSGDTKYTAVDGTAALKQAIIDKLARENQLEYNADQVLVSCGAKHSIYNLMQALLNPGDEVVIPAPFWVSYPDMAILAGAKPVVIKADIKQGYKITKEQLSAAMNAKTKLVILNSPSNPTGAAYTKAELTELAQVLLEYPDAVIITDDIYEHILWSDEPFCNIVMAEPKLYDRTVVINGVSKAYAMTGWRIGYAAGDKTLIAAMRKLQGQSTSNPCSIAQAAAVAALSGPQDCIKPMLKAFKERHDFVVEKLNAMPGVNCIANDGTFYAFPDVSEAMANLKIKTDVEFAEFLLTNARVAVVPGSAFGMDGYLRLSYATSQDKLAAALQRIEDAL